MSGVLFFDPHGDDVALFAAYTATREVEPHVIVTHQTVPRHEILMAYSILGCTVEFWEHDLESQRTYLQNTHFPFRVYAPAWHEHGHEEHNLVSDFARDALGASRVAGYLTYGPRGQRLNGGLEVFPEPEDIWRKLRAIGCFRSQIEQSSTRPWFYNLLDMREWVS
jgi:hypothetical protein